MRFNLSLLCLCILNILRPTQAKGDSKDQKTVIAVLVAVIVVILIFVAALVALGCFFRRRARKKQKLRVKEHRERRHQSMAKAQKPKRSSFGRTRTSMYTGPVSVPLMARGPAVLKRGASLMGAHPARVSFDDVSNKVVNITGYEDGEPANDQDSQDKNTKQKKKTPAVTSTTNEKKTEEIMTGSDEQESKTQSIRDDA